MLLPLLWLLDVVKVMMAYVVAIVVVVGKAKKRNGREKEGGKERSREELFVTEAVALVL
jgi:hypothetical protein